MAEAAIFLRDPIVYGQGAEKHCKQGGNDRKDVISTVRHLIDSIFMEEYYVIGY